MKREKQIMKIVVTGGAGYIGSHFVKRAVNAGNEVIVIDNFSTGHPEAVDNRVKVYDVDIRDKDGLDNVFGIENNIEAVVHFAAHSIVAESMKDPLKYYNNNISGTISLLEVMDKHDIRRIVFSSTAAVYGEPKEVPIVESLPCDPINIYGFTKLTIERMLSKLSDLGKIRYVAFRYFNACGADDEGNIGEAHDPETHLIPIVFQTLLGKRDHIDVFGTDYDTNDGTCIRDYIHVNDLADAHLSALTYLSAGGCSNEFNLGNCTGFSVKEIINSVEVVTGEKIKVQYAERRDGDPAILIASYDKAEQVLGWRPKYDDINKIIKTAWNWHNTHPNGY